MSYLGLDSLNEQNLLDQATRLGVEGRDPGPGIFSGIGEAFVKGPASGLYKTLGAFNRGVVAPVAKTLVGPIDALKGDFALSNWIDDQVNRNRLVVDSLKPDQRTSGVVAQVVHGLGELLPMGAMAVATGGAPALAALPEVAGAILGQEAVYQGIQDKLDPGTALGMGAITALSTWAGMKLPMNAGSYLEPLKGATGIAIKDGVAANIMIGAAANPPIGMVARGTTAEWLKANGYPEMAENYKILDKEAIAVDLIMGGGFGALAHYGPMVGERYQKWRDGVGQGILDSDYDAALAMNNNIHLETGIAPGIPADPSTREAHLQAAQNTLRAVLAGEPIVIGDGITNGTWVENPSAEIARLEVAQAVAKHMGQDWVDLQHDTHQNDLGALKAELEARGMDTSMLDLSGPARERQTAQAQAVDLAPPGVQIPGAITGRMGELSVNGVYYPTQWVLVDAAQHQATIGKADNQFRNRRSPASEAQMESIANAPDIRQLLDAPLMDYGAPTMDRHGNIIGGNGRFEGLSRAYDRGTGNDYLGPLKERLAQYGIDPAAADGMKKPVLVRAFVNEMNTKKTAIMSNAGSGLRMSELELAKQDAESLSDIRGLVLNDNGSISMAANKARIMAWMADMPQTEINTIIDSKTGALSIEGERRFQHAILYQAFGDGPTLTRLIESRDPEVRNVALALVRSGPTIAEARALIAAGDMYPIDITQDLTAAVEKLAELRRNGTKLAEYLLQNEMFAENQLSLEARKILVFLAENNRSVKAMSEMVNSFFDQVKAAGNPNAKGIFDMAPPAMGEILDQAIAATGKRIKNGELVETAPAADQKPAAEVAQPAPQALPREDTPDAPVNPGEEFLVVRTGSEEGLQSRNGASPQGLAAFLADADDPFSSVVAAKGQNLFVYAAKVDQPFGQYSTFNNKKGGKPGDAVGRREKHGGVWYSFPENGYEARLLYEIPMTEVRARLKELGFQDFDETGSIKGGEIIREMIAERQKASETAQQPAPDLSNLPLGERLQYRVDNDFEGLLKEYAQLPDAMGGKMVSGDIAKELSPEYMKDRTLAAEVHEAASAFAKKLYQHILDQPVLAGQNPVVLITGGGTGAGKTTGLSLIPEAVKSVNAIYDTTMGAYASSEAKVQQALDAGRRVILNYVYRDPVDAFVNGNLSRAVSMEVETGSGRTVPISAHAESHIGARETIQRLAEHYADDKRVFIAAVDNSRGRGNQAFVPLDTLPKPDSKNLGADLYAALEKEYRNANISRAIYEATAGNDRPSVSGVRGEGEPGVSGIPSDRLADVPGTPVQSQELRHLQDPEVGAALADHRDMLIPTETGQAMPAFGALDIADANVAKAEADAPAFDAAITCFLRG